MSPEELLHAFGPFLPTDRFRALLRGEALPESGEGAALMLDMSGFTPLAARLVADYGPRRAGEELRRRLNPMFEATAGQVFQHGGSVIRFVGDGFVAWFDDRQNSQGNENVPGLLRAAAAGLNIQSLTPLFRGLSLRIGIGQGTAYRWVVGREQHGLADVLSGPAVEQMVLAVERAQSGQVVVASEAQSLLANKGAVFSESNADSGILTALDTAVAQVARQHRWPAWQAETSITKAVEAVRPFVASALRETIESGLSGFLGELRQALPIFVRLDDIESPSLNAQAALDRCVCAIQDVLAETGGRLMSVEVSDKGSVVFAVFGAPVAYGDDSQRALWAALSFRDGIEHSGVHSIQRIGISRGIVYAGVIGGEVRHEYSTIGDETNVASRLMAAAGPGQILVTSRVREEIRDRITFRDDLPPILVKGRDEPVEVSEVLAVSDSIARRAHLSNMVGRMQELAQVNKIFDVLANGLARIVRIEGEAGIGKSRFVAELERRATKRGFRAVSGECLSTGRSTPYLPWRDVLFSLFGLAPDVPVQVNVTQLTTLIGEAKSEWLTRLPLLAELLQLPIPNSPATVELSGHNRRQAVSALVVDVISYFAGQTPLVIVLEDVQWLDEVSEALVLDLARCLSIEPTPIMLVLTHRPLDAAEKSGELYKTLADFYIHSILPLGDLSLDEVGQLIERHLNATPSLELLEFAYDQARGNPFFIQELLDTLSETGIIAAQGQRIVIKRTLSDAGLPRTIQGLLQARMDRLSEPDKLVLKVAAVIGREFEERVLAASLPISLNREILNDKLQMLVVHDFLHVGAAVPDVIYQFKHALTQDVAYQTLPFAQRQQLHRAVGIALEGIHPEAVEQLAYHFVRGGQNSSTALLYLDKAARKAAREYANQAALDYLEQALPLTVDPAQKFDLYDRRLELLLRTGQLERVAAELNVAQSHAEANNRLAWITQLRLHRANFWRQKSDWQAAVDEARQAVDDARAVNNDRVAWEAGMLLLSLYRSVNDPHGAERLFSDLKILAERLDDLRKDVQLALQEFSELYLEQPRAALIGARSVLAQAETIGDPTLEADCWALIAEISRRSNDLPTARDAFRHQLALLQQVGDRHGEGQAFNALGQTLIGLGQLSEANGYVHQAYTILNPLGERRGAAFSLCSMGVIASLRQSYDESLAYLQRGLATLRELDVSSDIALALFYVGNSELRKANLPAAEVAFQEALSRFDAVDAHKQAAEAAMGLAEWALETGDEGRAHHCATRLIADLEHGQVSDLQFPGLAYWRAIRLADRLDPWLGPRLRQAFLTYFNAINTRLDPQLREAFGEQIWYHRELLSVGV